MDPLSLTTSIISIAAVAASTAHAFKELRELCKTLPGRLHALSNEVSDIELVLHQVALVVEKRTGKSILEGQEAHIQHLLNQAGTKLEELKIIVDTLRGSRKQLRHQSFERTHGGRISQNYKHCRKISRLSNVASTSCWEPLILGI